MLWKPICFAKMPWKPFFFCFRRFVSPNFRGVTSTPDPDTSESIAIHIPFLSRYFCKSMPSSWQKVVYTPPICITIRLPFVSRCFCRSIRVRVRWNTPKFCAVRTSKRRRKTVSKKFNIKVQHVWWFIQACRQVVATIRVNGVNVFAWIEWMSEAVRRWFPSEYVNGENEPSCSRKKIRENLKGNG